MHDAFPRNTDRSAPWSRRAELCVAALLLALPVGFLLTYHSPRPTFWRYSATALAGVLGFLGVAALVLSRLLPSHRWGERARSGFVVAVLGLGIAGALCGRHDSAFALFAGGTMTVLLIGMTMGGGSADTAAEVTRGAAPGARLAG